MEHKDIFDHLDDAFGLADDSLIDSRIEEELRDLKITGVSAYDDAVLKQRITVEEKFWLMK